MGSGRPIKGLAAGWNARGRQQWRDDGNGLVERSCGKVGACRRCGRLEVGVTCPRIFEWLPSPEVELSILAENSLFFEKKLLLGLQNSVPLLKLGHLFQSLRLLI
jgi:hypothetical protein